jgi:hypothetical protein
MSDNGQQLTKKSHNGHSGHNGHNGHNGNSEPVRFVGAGAAAVRTPVRRSRSPPRLCSSELDILGRPFDRPNLQGGDCFC